MRDATRTRRGVLKRGTALAGIGAVAGCLGSAPGAGNESTSDSHTVSMEPVGEVGFDAVPETWVANNGSWADMGIALGQDPPEGVWLPSRYQTRYYDEIPGVSVDRDGITALYQDGVSKETFYDLDGDVHVMDPNFVRNRFDWSADDVAEVERQIAPFFGNSIFSSGYEWHEDYRYKGQCGIGSPSVRFCV